MGKKSRPSVMIKQLDIVSPPINLLTMEEFAQDVKIITPLIFKDIKNFINKKEGPPFCGEV